ncbi:EDD domain protein, DegV family [Deinococcus reticulitermitis]|uniref:EDD domain protein, DegV family n=1 Tax=Deinococcus reticulitermitis TaxID=856736 RepID=A0A1H6WJM5_9DEIO|nr:DegV family protein [Deinococcus reticulitermitis]SEJ12672.1 EDD domain protein, DegV family [Deinococcus reticulitermitis]
MTQPSPQFSVVTDGGLDALPSLLNQVPVAPFSANFGETTYAMNEISREKLYHELQTNPVHPTSSQPSPQQWLRAFEKAGTSDLLAVTISSGLSGSRNAAEQARDLTGRLVTIHDSMTLSAAQAFQVHAAQTAAQRGLGIQTALEWMRAVHEETELYFTIETLDYLRRGGRIGRVAAALGGLLNLKPVVTVDKANGTYVNAARARSYQGGIEAVTAQVTRRFGEGTPLRLGLLYGSHPEDADQALSHLSARHPIVWSDRTGVNPVLSIHVGPRALGVAAAPGPWPWER